MKAITLVGSFCVMTMLFVVGCGTDGEQIIVDNGKQLTITPKEMGDYDLVYADTNGRLKFSVAAIPTPPSTPNSALGKDIEVAVIIYVNRARPMLTYLEGGYPEWWKLQPTSADVNEDPIVDFSKIKAEDFATLVYHPNSLLLPREKGALMQAFNTFIKLNLTPIDCEPRKWNVTKDVYQKCLDPACLRIHEATKVQEEKLCDTWILDYAWINCNHGDCPK